jgi:hypothetical protein
MPRISFLPALVATAIAWLTPAIAQQPQQPQQPAPRPCAAIRQVCLQSGFVQNGVRAGEGLIVDCIRPIMMGTAQRVRAVKPLPAVDPALVEACRAQNPNFGMGNARQGKRRDKHQDRRQGKRRVSRRRTSRDRRRTSRRPRRARRRSSRRRSTDGAHDQSARMPIAAAWRPRFSFARARLRRCRRRFFVAS